MSIVRLQVDVMTGNSLQTSTKDILHYHEWTYRAFNDTEQLISESITDSKNNGDDGWSEVDQM